MVWPLTIEHYIDENSPFWTISAEDLKKERFELAVILEGIVESTGMTTQARSSYLVNEILWGHRFEKLITFQKEDGTYKIDYSRFNMTVPIDTPTCSAKDLAELKEQEKFFSETLNDSTPSTINSRDIIGESTSTDLRKRRIESSKLESLNDENYNEENAANNPNNLSLLTTPNTTYNNIRMVIEDHSSGRPRKVQSNQSVSFENLNSSFNGETNFEDGENTNNNNTNPNAKFFNQQASV